MKYKALLDVVRFLNSSLDFDEVKEIIIEQAKVFFHAEASSLIFLDKEKDELYFEVATGEKGNEIKEIRFPANQGIAGWIVQNKKSLLVADVTKDPRFFKGVDKKSKFQTKSIIGTPVFIDGEIIGLIEVLNKVDGGTFTEKELKLLEFFADFAALNIKNALFHKETLEKERLKADLTVAGEIQRRLLPSNKFKIEGYEYVSEYKACKSVGGDYFDIIKYDDTRVLFVIADVSGKGAPASIVMSSVRAYLRTASAFKLSLEKMVDLVNRNIYNDTEIKRFVTMVVGILDLKKNSFDFINCGHHYPIVISKDGNVDIKKSNDIPIGIIPDFKYATNRFKMERGDILLLFTDGIVEEMNENSELYDEKRLVQIVLKNKDNFKMMGDIVFSDVLKFSGGKQSDDMTLLFLRRI